MFIFKRDFQIFQVFQLTKLNFLKSLRSVSNGHYCKFLLIKYKRRANMKYDTSLVSFVSPFMAHTAVQTPPFSV